MPANSRVLNAADSTDGVCDQCGSPIEDCECEDIICQTCEDGLPRLHKCAGGAAHCEYCGESINDCQCQPSYHYD